MTTFDFFLRHDARHSDAMRLGARNGAALQWLPRPRRRSRSSPSIFVALAWAIVPNLIGMCLFLLVVGVVAGTWPL